MSGLLGGETEDERDGSSWGTRDSETVPGRSSSHKTPKEPQESVWGESRARDQRRGAPATRDSRCFTGTTGEGEVVSQHSSWLQPPPASVDRVRWLLVRET